MHIYHSNEFGKWATITKAGKWGRISTQSYNEWIPKDSTMIPFINGTLVTFAAVTFSS